MSNTLLGNAYIRIRPDTSGFGSSLNSGVSGALKNMAGLVTGALAGIGAAAAVKSIVDIGRTYQDTLNNLAAVSGATANQMAAVSQRAKELGSDTSLTATSAADAAIAMTELAKGGLSVDEAMRAAQGTLQLASAAGVDAAQAASIQSAALNAFNLSADQSGRVADVLANAANAAAGEITDFAMGLSQASAVAAATGISLEDTAATLGILANNGIAGSDAGTLLKSALLALQSPSGPAEKAMTALSLSAYDASGNFVGLSSVFGQLATAQKKMTPEAYAAATSTLFGSDAARLAGIAGREGAEGFDAMAEAMSKGGSAAEVAAAKAKGVTGSIEAFQSQLETVQIEIFEAIAPAIEGTLRKAGAAFESFAGVLTGTVIPGIQGLYDLIVNGNFNEKFATAFNVSEDAPIVDYILRARDAVTGFYDLLVNGNISSALLTAFNIEEDNPVIGWVLDARTAVDNIWVGLGNFWDGLDFSGFGESVMNALSETGGNLISGLITAVETGNWVEFGSAITTAIGDALSGAAELASRLWSWISEQLGKVDWIGLGLEIGKQVPTLLAGLALGILNFDLAGLLSGLADNWFDVLMGILTIVFLPGKIIARIAGLLRKIPFVGKLLGWFLEAIHSVGRSILGWVGKILGGFVRGFTGGGSRIVTAFKDIFETVKTQLFVWWDNVLSWFQRIPGNVVQVAENLGASLRAKFDEIMAWIANIFRSGVEGAVNIFRGIGTRIAEIAQNVWTWVVQKFTGMKDAVVGIFTSVKDFIIDRVWTPFASKISEIAGNVWTWVKDKFTAMKDGTVSIFQGIADTVGNIWNGLLDLVKTPVRVVLDFINNSIIGNINKVTEKFGLTIPTISYSFATGGIVPGGYSPGRDNALAAVGSGEAIMRPEWTRAVGSGYVNAANAAARTGGISGVKDFIRRGGPAFANGGIVGEKDSGGPLDWIGDTVSDGWNWAVDGIEGLLAKGAAYALKHLVEPAVGWVQNNVDNPFVKDFAAGAMNKLTTAVEEWGQGKDSEVLVGKEFTTGRGAPVGTPPAGSSFQQLFSTVKAAFPEANLNSGLRPGDPGFHGIGQAVDLGQVGRMGGNGHPYLAAMNRWIADSYPNSRELIYDGAGDDRDDLKNGRPHTYSAATRSAHKNHVHWVYDDGGVLEPGLTTVNNKSGKPEAVFTNDEFEVFKQIVANGGTQPLVGSMTFVVDPNTSMRSQVDQAMFEFRRIRRGGRFS